MSDDAIPVGQMTWLTHHEWDDTSTQIDGYLMPGKVQLDVIAAADLAVDAHDDAMAEIAWMNGGVHVGDPEIYGVLTLVIPGSTVTRETITEALRRFRP